MKTLLVITCFLMLGSQAYAKSPVEDFFDAMQMEKTMNNLIDQQVAQQISASPQLAPAASKLKAFFRKYMGWNAIKKDMARLYSTQFDEAELRGLTIFYKSNLGKKSITAMPKLFARGQKIATKAIMPHFPELQKIISDQLAASKEKDKGSGLKK
jgi:hypothetical protein